MILADWAGSEKAVLLADNNCFSPRLTPILPTKLAQNCETYFNLTLRRSRLVGPVGIVKIEKLRKSMYKS